MVILNEDLELVDAIYFNHQLEDLLRHHFPKLTDEHYDSDTDDNGRMIYCVMNVPRREMFEFLKLYGGGYMYEIRRSRDGMPISTSPNV